MRRLSEAYHHAARIGRPLNALITFRPADIDTVPASARSRLFGRLRDKLGAYARGRQHHFPPAFLWSREVEPNGAGEHMHVLMHVPARWRAHFDVTVTGWLPGATAVDVRPVHGRTRIVQNGKRFSVLNYMSKQMTPQAAWAFPQLRRKKGGTIIDKRSGVTRSLARSPI